MNKLKFQKKRNIFPLVINFEYLPGGEYKIDKLIFIWTSSVELG